MSPRRNTPPPRRPSGGGRGGSGRPPSSKSRQRADTRGRGRGGQAAVDRHEIAGPPPSVRALLHRFGLRPQKGFGQNFLIDEDVLEAILAAAEVAPDDVVVEVGPGLGVLTRRLVERAARVVAVELDRGMAEALRALFDGQENLTIVEGSILEVDLEPHLAGRPYQVVANLPYYITSPTLRRFLEEVRQPTRLVVMVQREVAERIVAGPGELSLLGVSVQYYARPAIVARVPRAAFYPPPKVDSAVVRIDVLAERAAAIEPRQFFRVVSAGFAQPRKQIHNGLSRVMWMPPGGAERALGLAGIDPTRRAQTLSIDEWAALARAVAIVVPPGDGE